MIGASAQISIKWLGAGHLGEVMIAERIFSRVIEICGYIGLRILQMEAGITGPAHPCPMIVRRIDGRRILGLAEALTIGIGKRAKVVIECVIFFDNDHDMFNRHGSLSFQLSERVPKSATQSGQARPLDLTEHASLPQLCDTHVKWYADRVFPARTIRERVHADVPPR